VFVSPVPPPGGFPVDPIQIAQALSLAAQIALFLPAAVTILLSLVVELVPSLATWWDDLKDEIKRAYRAWASLAIVFVIGSVTFFATEGSTVQVAALGIGWVMSIVGSEAVYQLIAPILPRKQGPDVGISDSGS
jgi:hypothetical protein